jgi:hypothetical protein
MLICLPEKGKGSQMSGGRLCNRTITVNISCKWHNELGTPNPARHRISMATWLG